ncbi:MAG TPA: hypothetical protein VF499_04465 [Afipia sp.]
MLPGFRILFATTVLAISILVFGLGAAALLRAAHEEFASLPSWRLAQQPPLTPQVPRPEITPVLAMLRIEAPGTKPLPEMLRREIVLPELAPQQPAARQDLATDAPDVKPAGIATEDNGGAMTDANEAAASAPVTEQRAVSNAQASIETSANRDATVREANAPDVKVSDSKIAELAEPKPAEQKFAELKSAELKSPDVKPTPPKAPVTEASEPLSTVASIERSSEATASAMEPKPAAKKSRRPSARAIAQRRQIALARAEARAKAEQLRQQKNAFPLFGG